jgi:uncharacterized membrane protein YphA (DoxX/SURF4 family)
MRWRNWLFDGTAQASVILVRLLVGWVFFSEGVQKFLFPAALGVGRFATIGIPAPHFFAPFVGVVEIVCGLLVIVGFLTRLAAIPLVIDISVAIAQHENPNAGEGRILGHHARSSNRSVHAVGIPVSDCSGKRTPVARYNRARQQ